MTKPEIHLFTDGSCPKNPGGPGAWAFIIRLCADGTEFRDSGGERETTNNRQEMMGPIKALEFLAARPGCKIKLVSDSQYVTKGITEYMPKWKRNNWRRFDQMEKKYEEIKNPDLWKRLDKLLQQHEISVEWVRGHEGHPENEECDEMAEVARQKVEKEMLNEKTIA